MLDPAINHLFLKMKTELKETKEKLESATSELAAWKFTPDSQTGKKLMARVRTLIQVQLELAGFSQLHFLKGKSRSWQSTVVGQFGRVGVKIAASGKTTKHNLNKSNVYV